MSPPTTKRCPLITAFVVLLLLGVPSFAQEIAPAAPPAAEAPKPGAPKVVPVMLVLPVKLSTGVELTEIGDMATSALKRAIEKQPPWQVTILDANSPVFVRAVQEKKLTAKELDSPKTVAILIKLAKVIGASAIADSDISKQDNDLILRVLLRNGEGAAAKMVAATNSAERPPRVSREVVQQIVNTLANAAVEEASGALQLLAEGKQPSLSDQAREHLEKARTLMTDAKYDEALAEYDRALALEPTCADCCLESADAYIAKQNPALAIMMLKRALTIDPESLGARLRLADCYVTTDRPELAIEQYRVVLAKQPGLVAVREKLAQALLATGNRDEAIQQYKIVVAAAPNELSAHQKLAEVYLKARRYDPAISELREVVRINPTDQSSALNLGWLLLQQDRLSEGIAVLRGAHDRAGKAYSYDADRYKELIGYLDREAAAIYAAAYDATPKYEARKLSAQDFEVLIKDWHARSDNLARLAELTAPPTEAAASHHQRVFCYRLLNQSDYELLQYVQTGQKEHLEQASRHRDAARTALTRAMDLDQQKPVAAPAASTTPAQ